MTPDEMQAEIDRLKNELKTETETVQHLIGERTADREHWGAIEDSLNRAERILAALREPSEGVSAVIRSGDRIPTGTGAMRFLSLGAGVQSSTLVTEAQRREFKEVGHE